MDFLKKLFGGGGSDNDGADRTGLYFYVRPKGCQEVIRVRIDANNDLSLADDNSTYYVRKVVRGTTYKCTREAELELFFDAGRRLSNTQVTSGDLVAKDDYEEWVRFMEAE